MATPNRIEMPVAKPPSEKGESEPGFEWFNLPDTTFTFKLYRAKDLDPRVTTQLLLSYEPFIEWIAQLKTSLDLQRGEHPFHDDPYELKSVHIQTIDFFGSRVGFLKYRVVVQNARGMELPGGVFMRGGSVGMLMILRPKDRVDEKWVIMTEQARIPAGSLAFLEIPAGMIDGLTKDFKGAAAKEIEEETGLVINTDHLVDMTELALRDSPNPEGLKPAMYPTPGGSDEFIALFLWEQEMERLQIEDLREKLTGDKKQGEMITLKLIRYEDLWRVAARDAKTMVAWALYESLKRAGVLDTRGNVVGDGTGGSRRAGGRNLRGKRPANLDQEKDQKESVDGNSRRKRVARS